MAADPFQAAKLAWLQVVVADPLVDDGAARVAQLLALQYLSREVGCAWPAIETMAANLARSANAIRRAVRTLEAQGHLLVERGGGRKAGSADGKIRGASSRYWPLLDGLTLPQSKGLKRRLTPPQDEGLEGSYPSITRKGKQSAPDGVYPSVRRDLTLPPVEAEPFEGTLVRADAPSGTRRPLGHRPCPVPADEPNPFDDDPSDWRGDDE